MITKVRLRWSLFRIMFCSVLLISVNGSAFGQELKQASATLAAKITESQRKRVAVVDFTDLCGNVSRFGRYLAEELSGALVGDAKGFRVMDRSHLQAILQEHKLATTGLIDPQTARQLGQFAGVDTLVTGTITSAFGDSVRVMVKALDVSTAEIIAQSTADIPKTDAIKNLLGFDSESSCDGSLVKSKQPPEPRPVAKVPDGGSSNPPNQESVGQSASEDDFSFELKSCQRSGTTVKCRFLITNDGVDRQLTMAARTVYTMYGTLSSRTFDQGGGEYQAGRVQLGNKENDLYVEADLVSGVPISAMLTFEKIPAEASRLTVLEMSFLWKKGFEGKFFTVQMRNIPLVR
jgi:hypothetical protein